MAWFLVHRRRVRIIIEQIKQILHSHGPGFDSELMHMALQPGPDQRRREMAYSPPTYTSEGRVGMGQCCFGTRSRMLMILSAANMKDIVLSRQSPSKARPTLPPRELRLLRALQDTNVACMVNINHVDPSALLPSEGKRREAEILSRITSRNGAFATLRSTCRISTVEIHWASQLKQMLRWGRDGLARLLDVSRSGAGRFAASQIRRPHATFR
jgi:hypothetical protein